MSPRAPSPRTPGRGRRPAGADTRADILAAARAAFAEQGYDRASLRGIAREARVDPALVHHYFEGKAALFAEVVQIGVDPRAVVDRVVVGDPGLVGERAVRAFLAVWDDPSRRPQFVALVRSAVAHEAAARMIREFLAGEVFGRIVVAVRRAQHGGPERPTPEEATRAGLAAAQMLGVGVMRYVVELPALVDASPEDLVTLLGATLQRYLVPEGPTGV